MTSNDIRRQFLDYFASQNHRIVPSAPAIPHDDPTLMFTNAGMNQFKDVFLGTGTRPYKRAADTQKCIRVSGKHNDLEEVGRSPFHHTFFEMLGNWSFGDYFKREAIRWAWELLTGVYGLPKDRLYATVFGGDESDGLEPDEEALNLWKQETGIDPGHIGKFSKKDNFWEMGASGPCGPCSEIHIDLTPDGDGGNRVNTGSPEVIEIWNLVFIQYNRDTSGRLSLLPDKHVDTGMGFERLCAVVKHLDAIKAGQPIRFSNYGTDVFRPLIEKIEHISGHRYGASSTRESDGDRYDATDRADMADVACRVIADHVRMLTFSMTDGALPGNEGRGYVLRRILRRAVRFGRQHLNVHKPFIFELVPVLAEHIGGQFPELRSNPAKIAATLRDEEESFGRTLDRGIKLFTVAAEKAKTENRKSISGDDAFQLYDTYGFPVDLTVQMAEEQGLGVDSEGFDERMRAAKAKARAAAKKHVVVAFDGELPKTDESPKYEGLTGSGHILGWIKDHALVSRGRLTPEMGEVGIVLDRTCFYAEQGGQIGDTGTITTTTGIFDVDDTIKLGDGILHVGHVGDGTIEVGQEAGLAVDDQRQETIKNHTATHLMHWALRQVLGDHVVQRGSLVEPDRLRFDFDHSQPVSRDEIVRIERLVNERVQQNLPVRTRVLPIDEARSLPGVRAFFGDKYGDAVRVVEIGDGFSREFCGGTHLGMTGHIGLFKVVGEESVAKGVRRITALTGRGAVEHVLNLDSAVRRAAAVLNVGPDQLADRAAALAEEVKKLRKKGHEKSAADSKDSRSQLLQSAERVGEHAMVVGDLAGAGVTEMREAMDWFRKQLGSAIIFVGAVEEDKVTLMACVSDDLVGKGHSAGDLIKQIAPIVGGGGGGKKELAQAGGKNPAALPEALNRAKELIRERLRAG